MNSSRVRVPVIYNHREGPERGIQNEIIKFLMARDWFVLETHGNMYQRGFPDLYATHIRHGHRWIEVKYAENYCFTPAQLETFPKLCKHGAPVWILVAANESEYRKLFQSHNWHEYFQVLNTRGVRSLT